MFMDVIGGRMSCSQRRAQNKRDLILLHYVTGAFSHASFRSAIGHRLKTERALIKMRRLLGVTDVKLDVICALKRQEIFSCQWSCFRFWSSNCRWHNDLLNFSRRARLLNI